MELDTRWRQRFDHFSNALSQLRLAMEVSHPNDLEKEGTIQRFEFTHELAWQLMKDFLKYERIAGIIGSRSATRQAFNKGMISDWEAWMEMIESRNKTVHTYSREILEREYNQIRQKYFPLLELFHQKMSEYL